MNREFYPLPSAALRPHILGGVWLTVLLSVSGCTDRQDTLPAAIPDTAFARIIDEISEPGAYFDTDNLISNESSYLHAVGALEDLPPGGIYIGVGPAQNFAYIAAARPSLAFIVDIRRDNLLQHLLLKSVMEAAATRVEYLSLLVGVAPPTDPSAWRDSSVAAIVAYVDLQHSADTAATHRAASRTVDSLAARHGVPLTAADSATIRLFHDRFMADGLGLRFTTHGRAPMWYYPTLRDLLLETDTKGGRRSHLADRDAYDLLRELQVANRIVPVVGDLGGPHAIRAIGREARLRQSSVSAFYTSNVEFYLIRDGSFDRWAKNLTSLPLDPAGLLIRSYFPGGDGRQHPLREPGYFATQIVEPFQDFVSTAETDGYAGWFDLSTLNARSP